MANAIVRTNGRGGWYAYCRTHRWTGATYEGPLAEIDADDDADDHNRQTH